MNQIDGTSRKEIQTDHRFLTILGLLEEELWYKVVGGGSISPLFIPYINITLYENVNVTNTINLTPVLVEK